MSSSPAWRLRRPPRKRPRHRRGERRSPLDEPCEYRAGRIPVEQRSQRRTKALVPVVIHGTDARGEAFDETLEAQDVSRRGLSVLTRRDLALYSSLSVTIPGRGPAQPGIGPSDFFSAATVVRVERLGEQNRVAIRFVGSTLTTYVSESL
ncbi:MAG: hypothetical protein DMG21_02360 [Acidobacteria bacterium]|nr:MAG: hypothetical protein DMG21_02360 [Acidobacteriota bacterium]